MLSITTPQNQPPLLLDGGVGMQLQLVEKQTYSPSLIPVSHSRYLHIIKTMSYSARLSVLCYRSDYFQLSSYTLTGVVRGYKMLVFLISSFLKQHEALQKTYLHILIMHNIYIY